MTPFALSDTDGFVWTVAAAGFRDVAGEGIDVEYVFKDAAEFTQYRRDRSGPLIEEIAHISDDRRNAAWAKITEAAEGYAGSDGRVRMRNKVYCLSAAV